jgi:hypothetical protein
VLVVGGTVFVRHTGEITQSLRIKRVPVTLCSLLSVKDRQVDVDFTLFKTLPSKSFISGLMHSNLDVVNIKIRVIQNSNMNHTLKLLQNVSDHAGSIISEY